MQDNYDPFNESIGPLKSTGQFYAEVEKIYKANLIKTDDPIEHIDNLVDCMYSPLRHQYELYRFIYRTLKRNYRTYDMSKIKADSKNYRKDSHINVAQKGFIISGLTGSVKSTYIDIISQIIGRTKHFPGYNFVHITILVVECPHKPSTRALCLSILAQIDFLLDTDYKTTHNAKTEPDFIHKIISLIQIHKIGMIVIDEIHNLIKLVNSKKLAENVKSDEILKFIKSFANYTKIPIGYIGLPDAINVASVSWQVFRRMVGGGMLKFPNFAINSPDPIENELFDLFMEDLWTVQVSGQEQQLTPQIKAAYFLASLGSPDMLKNIHKLCLKNIIYNSDEKIIIDASYVEEVLNYNLYDFRKLIDRFNDVGNQDFFRFEVNKKKGSITTENRNSLIKGRSKNYEEPEPAKEEFSLYRFKKSENTGELSNMITDSGLTSKADINSLFRNSGNRIELSIFD